MKIIKGDGEQLAAWLASADSRRRADEATAKLQAAAIIEAVRRDGDAAVSRLLMELDGIDIPPTKIRESIDPTDIDDEMLRGSIDLAIERITRFHSGQRTEGYSFDDEGSRFEHIVRPLRRVGIYVPGGRAVYLSTLIMCAIPSRLAGVRDIVVATTPRVASQKEFRYVCGLFGIREVYRAGGASGVAALALGTQSLERVDKIVGPGNRWVAAAKQLLFGETGIDMTAGPSEIVVIADESSDVQMVAADLRAQAEHGEDSASICITDSHQFASRLARVLVPDPRARAAGDATNITVVVTPTLEAGARLANRLAPEHLSIVTGNARAIADLVPDCGSVFLGSESPVALGDYVAGTNHVLPTGGSARFGSPLGVYDFYKRSNLVSLSVETCRAIAPAGGAIAMFEGLPAHARSMQIREEQP